MARSVWLVLLDQEVLLLIVKKDLDLVIDSGAQLADAFKKVLFHEIKNLVQLAQVSYDYIRMGIDKKKLEHCSIW